MGPIGCPETSVQNCHSTLRNIPCEGRTHLHRGASLKSRSQEWSSRTPIIVWHLSAGLNGADWENITFILHYPWVFFTVARISVKMVQIIHVSEELCPPPMLKRRCQRQWLKHMYVTSLQGNMNWKIFPRAAFAMTWKVNQPFFLWWRGPQQTLRTHRNLQDYCATLWWILLVFSPFFSAMEHRWNETDTRKPKYSGRNLSQRYFVHHKSHMDWPEIEPGPPPWQAEPWHGPKQRSWAIRV
jgi:hypothetical protein